MRYVDVLDIDERNMAFWNFEFGCSRPIRASRLGASLEQIRTGSSAVDEYKDDAKPTDTDASPMDKAVSRGSTGTTMSAIDMLFYVIFVYGCIALCFNFLLAIRYIVGC